MKATFVKKVGTPWTHNAELFVLDEPVEYEYWDFKRDKVLRKKSRHIVVSSVPAETFLGTDLPEETAIFITNEEDLVLYADPLHKISGRQDLDGCLAEAGYEVVRNG